MNLAGCLASLVVMFRLGVPGHPQTRATTEPDEITVTLDRTQLPAVPGYHVIKAAAHFDEKDVPLAFGVWLPPTYGQGKELMPMVVMLHNRGDSGSDGHGEINREGLAYLLCYEKPDSRTTGEWPKNPVNLRKEAKFVGLVPQCPAGHIWSDPTTVKLMGLLLDQVVPAFKSDPDRVFCTGFSYGASHAWLLGAQMPDRFAGIIPIDGRATKDPRGDAKRLKNTPIYMAVGDHDGEFIEESQAMGAALVAVMHPNLVWHVVVGGNHFGYPTVYQDPEFLKWLYTQRRKHPAAAKK